MKQIVFMVIALCMPMMLNAQSFQEKLKNAEAGDTSAMLEIGWAYLYGDGVDKNPQKAVGWLQRSASLGNPLGQYALAWELLVGVNISQNYELAATWIIKSAKQGLPMAQELLGRLYSNGDGVEKNVDEAFKWFMRAAESEYPEAYFRLFQCYYKGNGVTKDLNKAFGWCLKAAEQNYVDAQYWVGYCYNFGVGVSKDDNKAFDWFLKAAGQGHASAQYSVGWSYANGEVVKQSYEEAIKWYRLAMEQNNAWAYNNMAYLYMEGKGVVKDIKKAFELVDKAIEIEPEETSFYDSKGEFYSIIGDADNAIKIWNKILGLDPEHEKENTVFVQYILKIKGSNVDMSIPQTTEISANTFVIIIANEKYLREAKVPYSMNDGQIFASYCQKTLGLPEQNIRLIENATLNDLKYNLSWLKQVTEAYKGEAKVLFYYAGHGIPDEAAKTAYLLPVDGYASDVTTGYSLQTLYQELGEMPAKSVSVFLDACFSGAKREGDMLASARGVAIKVKETTPRGNMIVFSAAQGDETAYPYIEQQHGMFTYYLLKKLQETKGEATLGEIYEYVTDQVRKQSIVVNGKMQTPTLVPSASVGEAWKGWKLK